MTFDGFRWGRRACCVALIVVAPWTLAVECDRSSAVATLESAQGQVSVNRSLAKSEHVLCAGDTIRVGPFSRAAVRLLATSTTVRIDQDTQLQIPAAPAENRSVLDLLKGVIYLFSREPRSIDVNTVYANAAVEGTEFLVSLTEERSQVTVLEGTVLTSNAQGKVTAEANQTVVAFADQAPRMVETVKPEDAVQWALYYQPVLAVLIAPDEGDQQLLPADYRTMAQAPRALEHLAQVPASERDANYHVVRAGLLLVVGQADSARQDIEQALVLNPSSSDAKALQAMLAVARNELDRAKDLAAEAVAYDGQSAAARLAMSYAEQARFDLDAALASTRSAVDLEPGNALAWARLSELLLSFGNTEEALHVAQQAVELNDKVARTQTVLGFAYLAQIDTAAAKQAFEGAIALDQAAPLPRLGLGLGLVREGELAEGRKRIEVAVSLDPNNSLLRSYLGKLYFEQTHEDIATAQFDLAKSLDPLDPTPSYYSALLLQSQNRPVEALKDLEHSTQLNDNRAVYRSRLLLDKDAATRAAARGRIYSELGFDRLGVQSATKSLSLDPGNHSAHRFLSGMWATRPRHEIARVSELLSSQLLQPVNADPVPPQFLESDIDTVSVSRAISSGFNEYSNLYERDDVKFRVAGFAGNNDTWGNEAIVSGLMGPVSFSAGQYHSETDGFRRNNDLTTDLYNVFAQTRINPRLSVQAEYRNRDTENGDLRLQGDPANFDASWRLGFQQEIARAGVSFEDSKHSKFIFSFLRSWSDTDFRSSPPFFQPGFFAISNELRRMEGDQYEAQHRYSDHAYSFVTGVGHYRADIDVDTSLQVALLSDPGQVLFSSEDSSRETERHRTAYWYGDFFFPKQVAWTFGLGYADFERGRGRTKEFTPKFGLRWDLNKNLAVRLAAFKNVKRPFASDQTIEPTQIAGFNQFFDDANGAALKNYGVGVDYRFSDALYAGAELSRREIDFPVSETFIDEETLAATTVLSTIPERETLTSAYLYWIPSAQWSLSAEIEHDDFDSKDGANDGRLRKVETLVVPVAARFFDPSGFFGAVKTSFVDQEVWTSSSTRQDSSFTVVDVAVGYKLPRRAGKVSLEINNLTDERFEFQDDSFRTPPTSRIRSPRFVPERMLSVQVSIEF